MTFEENLRAAAANAVGCARMCHELLAPEGMWAVTPGSPFEKSRAARRFVDPAHGGDLTEAAHARAGNYLAVARDHADLLAICLFENRVNLALLSLGRVILETSTRAWHIACAVDDDAVRVARCLNEQIADQRQEASIRRALVDAEGASTEGIPGAHQLAESVCNYAEAEHGLAPWSDRQGRPQWVLERRPDAGEVVGEFQAAMGYPAGAWAYRVLCSVVHGNLSAFQHFSSIEDVIDDARAIHTPEASRIIEVSVRCPIHAYFESLLRMSDRYETGRTEAFSEMATNTAVALKQLSGLVAENGTVDE